MSRRGRLYPCRNKGMSRRIKSLQLRLTLELAALFFVASCLAVGGLIYSASLTAGSLADRELDLRAEDSMDANRNPRLELPPPLKQAYSVAAQQSLFAIRDKDGHLVEASAPAVERAAQVGSWVPPMPPRVLLPCPTPRPARRRDRRQPRNLWGPLPSRPSPAVPNADSLAGTPPACPLKIVCSASCCCWLAALSTAANVACRRLSKYARTGNIAATNVEPVTSHMPLWDFCHLYLPRFRRRPRCSLAFFAGSVARRS
jgi:hypothetical protein